MLAAMWDCVAQRRRPPLGAFSRRRLDLTRARMEATAFSMSISIASAFDGVFLQAITGKFRLLGLWVWRAIGAGRISRTPLLEWFFQAGHFLPPAIAETVSECDRGGMPVRAQGLDIWQHH